MGVGLIDVAGSGSRGSARRSPCHGLSPKSTSVSRRRKYGSTSSKRPAGVAERRPLVEVGGRAADGEARQPRRPAERAARRRSCLRLAAVGRLGRVAPVAADGQGASRHPDPRGGPRAGPVRPRGRCTEPPRPARGAKPSRNRRRRRRPRRYRSRMVAPCGGVSGCSRCSTECIASPAGRSARSARRRLRFAREPTCRTRSPTTSCRRTPGTRRPSTSRSGPPRWRTRASST